jgi:hypothetical protein
VFHDEGDVAGGDQVDDRLAVALPYLATSTSTGSPKRAR